MAANDKPGNNPTPDPAYSGAKAGTFTEMSTPAASPTLESVAMSSLLARNWWAVALRGVVGILFGIFALAVPGITIAVLLLWFAAYMFVDGIFGIVSAVRAATRGERWAALILEGIVDLVACAIALLLPIATVVAFVWLTGAWAIISGALMLSALFRLRPTHGKWLLGLGGVISVIWGVLLFLWPITGAVVLTWWLGVYAIVFGAAMLALAFQLRSRRPSPMVTAGAH